ADDYLVPSRVLSRTAPAALAGGPGQPAARWHLAHEPDAAGYARAVGRALRIMAAEAGQAGGLSKIVLSRSLLATADRPIDQDALLRRLAADPSITAFLVPLPPRGGAPRVLAGATPELLLAKTGGRIASHPLAGSARRQRDATADSAAAAVLARSDKDRREHAIVADFILDTLAPYCRHLAAPQGTVLTSTNSMWHLGTRIEGELKDASVSSAELAAALHPTPAVCGLPRARAQALISEIEPYDRDFYAGAVGWCDAAGDGAWHVSIRCAEIAGATARLYAGAGIVPGSDPLAEADETAAKYGALLAALGIELKEVRP
ncbi:MAG: Isochorismate synthase DhbC, partial [Roseomonas sp.]|nr:Isochorismate synthase DhbC [Roseomonas sp.]